MRDIRRLIIKDMKTTHACVHEKVDEKAKQRKRERERGSDRERESLCERGRNVRDGCC